MTGIDPFKHLRDKGLSEPDIRRQIAQMEEGPKKEKLIRTYLDSTPRADRAAVQYLLRKPRSKN